MPELPFEYLRQSLFFFRSHLSMVVRIQLPFLLLVNGLAILADSSIQSASEGINQAIAGLTLLNLTLMPIYTAATILYFSSVVQNKPLTAGQALLLGLSRWRHLLLVYLLTAFATFSGLLFLIVPGIFIMIRLGFADYACVIENRGPVDSLKDSWERTEPWFWTLLNGLAILFITITGSEMLVELLLKQAELSSSISSGIVNILFSLLNTLLTVYGFRIYCVAQQQATPANPAADD